MSYRRRPRAALPAMDQVNMTPLIDLAFSLLIIFMISTPLLEQSLEIDLPTEAAREAKPSDQKPHFIQVDAQGRYFWDAEKVPLDAPALEARLAALKSGSVALHVRAAKDLPYQRVIDSLNLIKRHHEGAVHLDTRGL